MLRNERYKNWMRAEREKKIDRNLNLNVIAYEADLTLIEHFIRDADFVLLDEMDSAHFYYVFHWAVQAPSPQMMEFFKTLISLLGKESYDMRLKPKRNLQQVLAGIFSRETLLMDNILHLIVSNDTLTDIETLKFIQKVLSYMPLENEQRKLINHKNDLGFTVFGWADNLGKKLTSDYLKSLGEPLENVQAPALRQASPM